MARKTLKLFLVGGRRLIASSRCSSLRAAFSCWAKKAVARSIEVGVTLVNFSASQISGLDWTLQVSGLERGSAPARARRTRC
jgi:hypothetical protein